tara:strand:- start:216 stop:668 length:453 start_codon:yes stop_codon:yes gene_type:complete
MINKYHSGKIYKILCNLTGEVYVGATVMSLKTRLNIHKSKYNVCKSKQIIERNDYKIILIKLFKCESRFELNREEGIFIKHIPCINKQIAGRTCKEYREDNSEIIRIKKKQKKLCECGISITKPHFSRHIKHSKFHKKFMIEKFEKVNNQ